ncbi:UNVERIFIED_ORG: hypothetical protein ABIC48_006105 [Burkholderia territorii]
MWHVDGVRLPRCPGYEPVSEMPYQGETIPVPVENL